MDHETETESVPLGPKGRCPECGGEKRFQRYTDGHGFCFGGDCGYLEKADGAAPKGDGTVVAFKPAPTGELLDPSNQPDPWRQHKGRKISQAQQQRWGHFTATRGSGPVGVYPHHKDGRLVLQKLRTPNKDFPVLKGEDPVPLAQCDLHGRHIFGDKHDRQIIICEGEEDAKAVDQVLAGAVTVVSITAGAGNAAANLKANYLYVNRFKDIVLWFDNDEAGRKAAAECAPLFRVGKVRVATTTGFMVDGATPCKDASDVLQAGRPGDIKTIIYAAAAWRPKGIVNAADNPEDVLAPKEGDLAFSYPWPWEAVTEYLGPRLPGQMAIHVAGTGIGKSTAVAHCAFDTIRQGGKVGYMSFEGTRREIKLSLMVVKTGFRVDLKPLPDDDMLRLHSETFGNGNMELFDPETAEWTLDACESYVDYMVKALGCQEVVIDPLSTLIAMADLDDERRAIDRVSMRLSKAAKELGCFLHISHHLSRPEGIPHEEGAPTAINQVRGSNGLANFATFVIGHERNQQAPDGDWTLTQLRSLKNRPRSRTGVMVVLDYNMDTGQLSVTNRKFPKPGKGEGGDQDDSRSKPFQKASGGGDDY